MQKYNIDENGAKQILRKAGWKSETYHIVPPVHTDVVLDYGELEKAVEKEIMQEDRETSYHELANFIRYLGGLELEQLNYYELIYDKVEQQVQDKTEFLKSLAVKETVRGKEFNLYSNPTAWKIVKERMVSRFPKD